MTGAAEGGEPCAPQVERASALEEFRVFDVRAGPAAFDVIDAEFIELAHDRQLVFNRKRHAFALRAITQRRVVDSYSHSYSSLCLQ